MIEGQHVATFHLIRNNNWITYRIHKGTDRMQAMCLAVKHALTQPHLTHYTILWLPTQLCEMVLTLFPYRNSLITQDIHTLISAYLQNELHTFHLRSIDPRWPGKPKKEELRSLDLELEAVVSLPLDPSLLTPKQVMWQKIYQDYCPNPHPTYIACIPLNPTPPPTICVAAASHNRLASATIFRWAMGHSFDAGYSLRFHPEADNNITCPCTDIPHPNPTHPHCTPYQHTKEHVLFQCIRYADQCRLYLGNTSSLRIIFCSEDHTEHLIRFALATNILLLRPLRPPHPRVPQPDPP